jgi:hypothetical protein
MNTKSFVAIVFGFLFSLACPGATPGPNSSISGRLTGPNGTAPLPNIEAYALQWNDTFAYWDWIASGQSDANGEYIIGGLSAGTYRVRFQDRMQGDYATEVYEDALSLDTGADIVVPSSTTVAGIDASMTPASKISGRVTGPDGVNPLEGMQTYAIRWLGGDSWDWDAGQGITDANGVFLIGGLPPGTYRIGFNNGSSRDYVRKFYGNTMDWQSGLDIVLLPQTTVFDIDGSLEMASRISGTVTGAGGSGPLTGIQVTAYHFTVAGWTWREGTVTDASGGYTLGGLPAGTYRVEFRDFTRSFLDEYYENGPDVNSGADINTIAGTTTSGIDASLTPASTISGSVTGPDGTTPLEYIDVGAYQWNSDWQWWEPVAFGMTDAGGVYSITGLPAGTYRVEFMDYTMVYLSEAYDNVADLDAAQDLVVATGITLSGIDASLSPPSSISGTLLREDGVTPIVNARIYARDYARGTDTTDSAARTDTNGTYRINGLRAGTYHVRTDFFDSPFLQEWYSDVLRYPDEMSPPTNATPVIVAAGADVTGIDFQLSPGGVLTGALTGASGLEVLDGSVLLVGITNGVVYNAAADSNGTYRVDGIFPDAYQVQAQAPQFKDEWFENTSLRSFGTPVSFAAGQQRQIDFELEPGQSPAIVNVTSSPPGAEIYLDYLPTGLLTPAFLDIGEVGAASRPVRLDSSDPLDPEIAINAETVLPHAISVKRPGSPLPPPEETDGEEGDVALLHFDMTSGETASVQVETTPAGASVYLNSADSPVGVSPILLSNLLPGSHTLLLARDGCLLPRPVRVSIATNTPMLAVNIPLTFIAATNTPSVMIDTTPDGAMVFLNHLSPPFTSDFETDLLDPASHAGTGWHSTEHVALVRIPGYLPASPRAILTATNGYEAVTVILVDQVVASTDADQDGLPDELEDVYDLNEQAPGESGPDDDPDQDGATNEEELAAGTNPLSANSVFATDATTQAAAAEGEFRYVFSTVPFRRYVVQASNDLSNPNGWTNVSGVITATSTRTVYVSPVAPEARFFRAVHISN